jgi:hypothetical protein
MQDEDHGLPHTLAPFSERVCLARVLCTDQSQWLPWQWQCSSAEDAVYYDLGGTPGYQPNRALILSVDGVSLSVVSERVEVRSQDDID